MLRCLRWPIVSAVLLTASGFLWGLSPRLEAAKPTGGESPGYSVTKLGGLLAPDGTLLVTQANGLNNPDANGMVQVVGTSRAPESATSIPYYAYVWTVSASGLLLATDNLGTLPDLTYSYGHGINNAGVVAGDSNGGPDNLSFVDLPATGMLPLPLGAFTRSTVTAVNDSDAIVGVGWDAQNAPHGVCWQVESDGTVMGPVDLGAFFPNAINDWGVMAGQQSGFPAMAALDGTSNVQVQYLGVLSGHVGGAARGINNLGDVVGQSNSNTGLTQAVKWPAGSAAVALASLGKNLSSCASDINEQGQIVGWSYAVISGSTMRSGALWENGVAYDLNALAGVSGKNKYRLKWATGINDVAQISGMMNIYGDGIDDLAVLLTRKP